MNNSNFANQERRLGYILTILIVALHYISISGLYLKFTMDILPSGDPFTYTSGFFSLLDMAHKDFWGALSRAFLANWYWLLNLGTVLFSPILIKEPFSISIINYAMWGLASISLFRLCIYLKFEYVFSLLIIFLIWFFPINFGYLDYTSIPVLGLDSMFFAALQLALFTTITYALDPTRIKNAIIAGFAVGIAIWGRGNSLPVVGLAIFIPVLSVLYRAWKARSRRLIIPVSIFAFISITMTTIFYILQGRGIIGYYYHHAHFVTRHVWNWHDAVPYLNNVPGFFFFRVENAAITIITSILFHLLVVLSFIATYKYRVKSEKHYNLFIISSIAIFIYIGTYITNIILFTDPLMTIYNCLLIYAPTRIGISLSLFTLIALFVLSKNISLKSWVLIPASAFFLFYGVELTKLNTPKPDVNSPSATKVETIAKNIDTILNGGSLSMLWYNAYSPRILNYYRIKNSMPEINFYMNKYFNDIWQQYEYTEEKRLMVRDEIKKHFEEADIIILPEYVDHYDMHFATAFARMKEEFPRYLNATTSKKFVVRAILHDKGNVRLLFLQSVDKANGQGEPLKLPYGPSSKGSKIDYGPKVLRF